MRYYEWLGELDAIEVNFPERNYNDYWMVEGCPVVGWDKSLTAIYNTHTPPVFHFGLASNAWPVFSDKLRSFFEQRYPGVIQFLPFVMRNSNGNKNESNYFVGQLLRLIDCLDRERTKVRANWKSINEWGDFGTYHPIVLSQQLIGSEFLFRVKGKCITIVIREDVVEEMGIAGFNGQRFDLLDVSK